PLLLTYGVQKKHRTAKHSLCMIKKLCRAYIFRPQTEHLGDGDYHRLCMVRLSASTYERDLFLDLRQFLWGKKALTGALIHSLIVVRRRSAVASC
ncbi:MAG: hypothetical protein ACXW02_08710, partial [Halobacteriota archaeon]